jgi:hypothetical protein
MVHNLPGKQAQSCQKGALTMTGRSKTEFRDARAERAAVAMNDVTPQQLAQIGEGEVAYVKAMRSDDISRVFPDAPHLAPGQDLFALVSADGSPILLSDNRSAALANAMENELRMVSLH